MTFDKLLVNNENQSTEFIKLPNGLTNSEKQSTSLHKRNHSRNLSTSSLKLKNVIYFYAIEKLFQLISF